MTGHDYMPNAAVLTRAQVREVDRRAIEELGISSLVLMENAGRGAADAMCQAGIDGPVVVVCGKGNNGGDGFVVARHLDLRGFAVRVLVVATEEELSPDGAANAAILVRMGFAVEWLAALGAAASRLAELCSASPRLAWLVDALLGTGATGNPREPAASAIRAMNASGVPIFALDLPSGLDCDTGAAGDPTIRAARTCTFAALKPGLLVEGAARFVGTLTVADIGVRVV
jgi:NAD(P)H-hydrate epimerase